MSAWLAETTQGQSARKVAIKVNRSHTAVAGWFRGEKIPAEAIIEIARAYRADPVAGLIAEGYISVEEMVPHMRDILSKIPVSFLTDELHARARAFELAAQDGVQYKPSFPIPAKGQSVS